MSDYDKLAELLHDTALGGEVTISRVDVRMRMRTGETYVYKHNGTGASIHGAVARLHAGEPPDRR